MSAPVLPVRRVLTRYDKRTDHFLPCVDTDRRGTLPMDVDAEGRSVMTVHANRPGWKLCFPTGMTDPAAFVAWMQKHPEMEIVK